MLRRARTITRGLDTKKEVEETLSLGTSTLARQSTSFAAMLAASSASVPKPETPPSQRPQSLTTSSPSSSSSQMTMESLQAEVHHLRAENERLRAKIHKIQSVIQE